jgi:GT2 family glycosyltransferase
MAAMSGGAVAAPPPLGGIAAVVPTLGRSPLLARCLAALRADAAQAGIPLELIVVDQGDRPAELPPEVQAARAARVLRPGENSGFAGGTNRGIVAALAGPCEWIATVNDDAVVEPGWTAALVGALAARPDAAAAQGVNLQLDHPDLADGWGLLWNRAWQAVQAGHGLAPPGPEAPAREVFGVSATAALYRRSALLAAALPGGQVFDERLGSYYEDADLACRLRAAGYAALAVPAARARHAGGATGRALGGGRPRLRRLYRNRLLVAARLLGGGLWRHFPAIAWRDAKDLARALGRGEGGAALAVAGGWAWALADLPRYARRGPPAVPLPDLLRFR